MKTLLLLLFLLPSQISPVTTIRKNVAYINTHLKEYNKKVFDHEEGISLEGGEFQVFRSKDTLKLVIDKTYGETGQVQEYYYYDKQQVIFAYIIRYDYNVPMNLPEFDLKKSKKTEQRYYFQQEVLVKGDINSSDILKKGRELATRNWTEY